jgi:hypothetical protein
MLVGNADEAAHVIAHIERAFRDVPSPFLNPDAHWATWVRALEDVYVSAVGATKSKRAKKTPGFATDMREWYFELPTLDVEDLRYVLPRLLVDSLIDAPGTIRHIEELALFLNGQVAPFGALALPPSIQRLVDGAIGQSAEQLSGAFSKSQVNAVVNWIDYVLKWDPVARDGEVREWLSSAKSRWRIDSR